MAGALKKAAVPTANNELLSQQHRHGYRHGHGHGHRHRHAAHGHSVEKVHDTICPSFRLRHLPLDSDLKRLRSLSEAHVESFNYMLEEGLDRAIADLEPAELTLVDPALSPEEKLQVVEKEDAAYVRFWMEHVQVSPPIVATNNDHNNNIHHWKPLFPREARERHVTYAGPLQGVFCYQLVQRRNGMDFPNKPVRLPTKDFGKLPIMVLSKACHLRNFTPRQLVQHREEDHELGGYFICNGIERCIRMLQVPRRNYPTAVQRSSYKKRGNIYTDLGVAMRCARYSGDESTITNTIHYLTTGGATLRFVAFKQEFLIPVVLLIRAISGGNTSVYTKTLLPSSSSSSSSSSSRNKPDTTTARPDAAAAATAGGMGITDEEFYRRIIQGDDNNTFLVARAGLLLQDARARYTNLNTPNQCLAYIGSRFRRIAQRAESTSHVEIGHYMIRRYILIHLEDYADKLESLLFLLRKLYAFAAGDCGVDNADSLQNQEILLPGHLICHFVKEKFDETMQKVRSTIVVDLRQDFAKTMDKLKTSDYWSKLLDRSSGLSSGGIGKKVAYFLATGNIISSTGMDLMQVSGYTIVAERINFLRYCSHFRSVHRGQFFMEMKTTAVRKLLPDQWGFLCPVHTPDGGPCGLLSHMAIKCKVLTHPAKAGGGSQDDDDNDNDAPPPLETILYSLGVAQTGAGAHAGGRSFSTHTHLPVCVDGRVVGGASPSDCKRIAAALRNLKVKDNPRVPATMEVALIPPGNKAAPYPGLFLFTGPCRMVRPVLQRATGKTEFIGPLEQGFLDIACLEQDIREGITTHQELDPTNILDLIPNMTPFSDQNQSPRNMYQCQMGKQTMGTPAHSLPYLTDNKLYRLQTPQAPLVQTTIHGEYKMDDYPNGTNAVIAVMSYTGFDMEDAMIVNKASYDRGFAHASVYKTINIDLRDIAKRLGATAATPLRFAKLGSKLKMDKVDDDGLPVVGEYVQPGEPLYCVYNPSTGKGEITKHKEKEKAYVQSARLMGGDDGKPMDEKASITLRFPRNPVIGDKFSSRHGQKGVLSILWPQEDLPFTESGIIPDILFNPHGFPSRMTIGMLVEMMAAKSGSLHGFYQNGTPFSFHESGDKISIDYFGEQLQAAGYNYYGSEPLYSGVSGCVMHADLYIGVVYYQRLRHMVHDKYQVRATGPTNPLTRQPIQGRKRGGGIRLGEMERDSLLSHGGAFLLHDRLLNCSDKHIAYACCRCGDLLMPTTERSSVQTTGQSQLEAIHKPKLRLFCRNPICREATRGRTGDDTAVEPIIMPYVYRYLVNELAGMNIGMKLDIS